MVSAREANAAVRAPAEPAIDQVWRWLQAVPDPEIPVISVVDLGIVRGVRWQGPPAGRELIVTVTPTYSGCPATDVIGGDIVAELQRRGVPSVRLETQLSPPWTTDWMTPEGRAKLEAFGIVAPRAAARDVAPVRLVRRRQEDPVACPRCGSPQTREVSRFGSTPCKALYACAACGEPFDYFKSL